MNKVNKIIICTVPGGNPLFENFFAKTLNKICKKLVWINLLDFYQDNGVINIDNKFLERIEKEEADFVLMAERSYYDLDIFSIISKAKKSAPKTKWVLVCGDDDLMFDSDRYLARVFDYMFIFQKEFLSEYKKDGCLNCYSSIPVNFVKKVDCKRIYPVGFMGGIKSNRLRYITYLIEKKVDIRVFGKSDWGKHPSIKEIYQGFLNSEDYFKTIMKTKINLCFSKNDFGQARVAGRFFEISMCRAFCLVEYCPFLDKLFTEGRDIVFFRDENELLEKVNYYLKNDKEREKIATAAFQKVKRDYDFEKDLINFIMKNKDKESKYDFLEKPNKIIVLTDVDTILNKKDVLNKVSNYDYIAFSRGGNIHSVFKNAFQAYSLKKTKKDLSCVDYFFYSEKLGNYAAFKFAPNGNDSKKDFKKLLDINQILMSKKFFIKNIDTVMDDFNSRKVNFVNLNNTAFVSNPLLKMKNFRKGFFKNKGFCDKDGFIVYYFPRKLLLLKNNIYGLSVYGLALLKEIVLGKRFIVNVLINKFEKILN